MDYSPSLYVSDMPDESQLIEFILKQTSMSQLSLLFDNEKKEFKVYEDINFSLTNTEFLSTYQIQEQNTQSQLQVTGWIVYKIVATYNYRTGSSCLDKQYIINKEIRLCKNLGKIDDKWSLQEPDTGIPTFQYKYHQQGEILNINLQCFLIVDYNFGGLKGTAESEIKIIEIYSPQPISLMKQIINCPLVTRNFLRNPHVYNVKISLDKQILCNGNQINLDYEGDVNRQVVVTCQLCIEFKIAHQALFQINAYPRIVLQEYPLVLNQEAKCAITITLPQGLEIPPLVTNLLNFFHCNHYLIIRIQFQNQWFFAENPCEIKIPIEVQITQYNQIIDLTEKEIKNRENINEYLQKKIKRFEEYGFFHLQSDQIYRI